MIKIELILFVSYFIVKVFSQGPGSPSSGPPIGSPGPLGTPLPLPTPPPTPPTQPPAAGTCTISPTNCNKANLSPDPIGISRLVYFYNNTCYVLTFGKEKYPFNNGSSACGLNNWINPKFDYGRMAVFFNNIDTYTPFVTGLQNAIHNQPNLSYVGNELVYLGAETNASTVTGNQLSDYCWQTSQNVVGPQITNASINVNVGPAAATPLCLAVNISNPFIFYGLNCSTAQYIVCEFGCNATEQSNCPAQMSAQTSACNGYVCSLNTPTTSSTVFTTSTVTTPPATTSTLSTTLTTPTTTMTLPSTTTTSSLLTSTSTTPISISTFSSSTVPLTSVTFGSTSSLTTSTSIGATSSLTIGISTSVSVITTIGSTPTTTTTTSATVTPAAASKSTSTPPTSTSTTVTPATSSSTTAISAISSSTAAPTTSTSSSTTTTSTTSSSITGAPAISTSTTTTPNTSTVTPTPSTSTTSGPPISTVTPALPNSTVTSTTPTSIPPSSATPTPTPIISTTTTPHTGSTSTPLASTVTLALLTITVTTPPTSASIASTASTPTTPTVTAPVVPSTVVTPLTTTIIPTIPTSPTSATTTSLPLSSPTQTTGCNGACLLSLSSSVSTSAPYVTSTPQQLLTTTKATTLPPTSKLTMAARITFMSTNATSGTPSPLMTLPTSLATTVATSSSPTTVFATTKLTSPSLITLPLSTISLTSSMTPATLTSTMFTSTKGTTQLTLSTPTPNLNIPNTTAVLTTLNQYISTVIAATIPTASSTVSLTSAITNGITSVPTQVTPTLAWVSTTLPPVSAGTTTQAVSGSTNTQPVSAGTSKQLASSGTGTQPSASAGSGTSTQPLVPTRTSTQSLVSTGTSTQSMPAGTSTQAVSAGTNTQPPVSPGASIQPVSGGTSTQPFSAGTNTQPVTTMFGSLSILPSSKSIIAQTDTTSTIISRMPTSSKAATSPPQYLSTLSNSLVSSAQTILTSTVTDPTLALTGTAAGTVIAAKSTSATIASTSQTSQSTLLLSSSFPTVSFSPGKSTQAFAINSVQTSSKLSPLTLGNQLPLSARQSVGLSFDQISTVSLVPQKSFVSNPQSNSDKAVNVAPSTSVNPWASFGSTVPPKAPLATFKLKTSTHLTDPVPITVTQPTMSPSSSLSKTITARQNLTNTSASSTNKSAWSTPKPLSYTFDNSSINLSSNKASVLISTSPKIVRTLNTKNNFLPSATINGFSMAMVTNVSQSASAALSLQYAQTRTMNAPAFTNGYVNNDPLPAQNGARFWTSTNSLLQAEQNQNITPSKLGNNNNLTPVTDQSFSLSQNTVLSASSSSNSLSISQVPKSTLPNKVANNAQQTDSPQVSLLSPNNVSKSSSTSQLFALSKRKGNAGQSTTITNVEAKSIFTNNPYNMAATAVVLLPATNSHQAINPKMASNFPTVKSSEAIRRSSLNTIVNTTPKILSDYFINFRTSQPSKNNNDVSVNSIPFKKISTYSYSSQPSTNNPVATNSRLVNRMATKNYFPNSFDNSSPPKIDSQNLLLTTQNYMSPITSKNINQNLSPKPQSLAMSTSKNNRSSSSFFSVSTSSPKEKKISSTYPDSSNTSASASDFSDCQPAAWDPPAPCNSSCGDDLTTIQTRKRYSSLNPSILCPPNDTDTQIVPCDIPKCNPMTYTEKIASEAMLNLGWSWVAGGCSLSIIAFLCLKNKNYLQIIQVNQDVSLLLAHVFLLISGIRNDKRFNRHVCKISAMALQYFFSVAFSLHLLEALHIYTILTDTILGNNALIAMKPALTVAWGVPGIMTAITGIVSYNSMMSDFSCWINMKDNVMFATFIPLAIIAWTTLILLEETGYGKTTQKSKNVTSCRVAHTGLSFVSSAQFVSWMMSSSAVYYQHISLSTLCLVLNILVGMCICSYHVFSNEKARALTMTLYRQRLAQQSKISK